VHPATARSSAGRGPDAEDARRAIAPPSAPSGIFPHRQGERVAMLRRMYQAL